MVSSGLRLFLRSSDRSLRGVDLRGATIVSEGFGYCRVVSSDQRMVRICVQRRRQFCVGARFNAGYVGVMLLRLSEQRPGKIGKSDGFSLHGLIHCHLLERMPKRFEYIAMQGLDHVANV
jgi:hypothetical protein